jgi:hypothetical protein
MWKFERRIYLEIENKLVFFVILSAYLTVQKLKYIPRCILLASLKDVHRRSPLYFSHTEVLKCFLEFVSTAFHLQRRL